MPHLIPMIPRGGKSVPLRNGSTSKYTILQRKLPLPPMHQTNTSMERSPWKISKFIQTDKSSLAQQKHPSRNIGEELKPRGFLMSNVFSGPPSSIPSGGLAFIGRSRATQKCSGSLSPSKYRVGAAPTVSSRFGIPMSMISAQIVE